MPIRHCRTERRTGSSWNVASARPTAKLSWMTIASTYALPCCPDVSLAWRRVHRAVLVVLPCAFNHGGGTGGILEGEPHNQVHGMVGGAVRDAAGNIIMGLMSSQHSRVGSDLLVHHANIDRLWEVWLKRGDGQNKILTDDLWINGPIDIKFTMPNIDGLSFRFSPPICSTQPRQGSIIPTRAPPTRSQASRGCVHARWSSAWDRTRLHLLRGCEPCRKRPNLSEAINPAQDRPHAGLGQCAARQADPPQDAR